MINYYKNYKNKVIEFLQGKVLSYEGAKIILLVNNIGYGIYIIPTRKYEEGKEYALFIHTKIYDDKILLYGFDKKEERDFFNLITSLPNFGPSIALSILSYFSVEEFYSLIQQEDISTLQTIKGLGTKKIKKLIIELKDKIQYQHNNQKIQDVISALKNLGFSNKEISLIKPYITPSLPIEENIKIALHKLTKI